MSYIAVIGGGSWGTALSCLLADKGFDVSLWVHNEDLCARMKAERMNQTYLPGLPITDSVLLTHDAAEALEKARYVINVVPSQYTRRVMELLLPHLTPDIVMANASKGIERKTLLTVSQVIAEVTGHKAAVLSGPSFALEVARKLPTAVTISSSDLSVSILLQEIFNTQYFRVYTHDDVIGVELGGALKNVIAIAAGICDGLGLGHNSRAALITRGLVEMKRLGAAMGAKEQTFSGLSGLGDLILTCTGPLSRNYTVGCKLGQGMKLGEILAQTKSVAEGIATAESVSELRGRYNLSMPIAEQVFLVLYEGKDPAAAVSDLMNRALTAEFHA